MEKVSPLSVKDAEKGKGISEMHRLSPHHQLVSPPHLARQWVPWLVPLILVANILLYVYEMYVNDCPSRQRKECVLYSMLGRFSFEPLRENPLLGPSATTLVKLGGLDKKLVIEDEDWWRLISCIWLMVHLATNMLSLMVVGTGREFAYDAYNKTTYNS